MKLRNFLPLLLIFSIPSFGYSQLKHKTPDDWSETQFQKADSLIGEGLPRDAELIYQSLFNRAQKEGNYIVTLKLINDRMINKCYFEEKALLSVIGQLKRDIQALEFPTNQIAHSILGNLYWQYYQQNRWRIGRRTSLSGGSGDDIEAWDLKRIVKEVLAEMDQSLAHATKLGQVKVEKFEAILGGDEDHRDLRPTLYDLMAHRALDIYRNDEIGLTSPVEEFLVYDPVYFKLNTAFVSFEIPNQDSLSLKYKAIKLLQELTSFHGKNKHEEALVDLELTRLKYVYNATTHPDKKELYQRALTELSEYPKSDEVKAEVLYRLAGFIYTLEAGGATNYYLQARKICESALKKYSNTEARAYFENLISKIEERSLSIKAERVVEIKKPFLVKVGFKNSDTVYCRLYKVNSNYINYGNKFYSLNLDSLKNRSVFKEWHQVLPKTNDYRNHSFELPVAGLDKGFYVLAISDHSELNYSSNSEVTVINVSDLFLLQRPSHGDKALFSINRRANGVPVSNAGMEFFIYKYDHKTRKNKIYSEALVYSDKNGIVEWTQNADHSNYGISVYHNGDTLVASSNYISNIYESDNRDMRTVLFTDRAIYRPGQTVFFKGLILDCSGDYCKVVSKLSEDVYFYDPNRQELAHLRVKSNEFGTFKGEFKIPTGLLNGAFHLECDYGEKYFKVEEYKRPTFEVKFDSLDRSYGFNENVKVKGMAKAFAGYPIDRARVTYRIVRKAESRWYWYTPEVSSKQIATGTTITDELGKFIVSYATSDKDIEDKDLIYSYILSADVTDANGETRSETHTLRVSSSPLVVKTNIPDVVNAINQPNYSIKTESLDGDLLKAAIEMKVTALKSPGRILFDRAWEVPDLFVLNEEQFRKNFPNRVYKDEANPKTWEEGKVAFSGKLHASDGIQKFQKSVKKLQQGYYKLDIVARDKGGNEAKWSKVVRVIQDKPALPASTKDWITAVKKTGEPGEYAEFRVAALTNETPVRYEIVHDEEIVKSMVLNLGDRVERIKVPIEEKYRGGFAVQFVQVAGGQAFISLQEIVVPFSNKKLDISFETFRNKLLPGEQEQWRMKVRNNQGEKESAEMLATLYDASLDAFAPLEWQTSFARAKNHSMHRWRGDYVPRISYTRRLSQNRHGLWTWSKSYEKFDFSYNYYGGYNSYYGNLQYRLTHKKEIEEQKKQEQKRKKLRKERANRLKLNEEEIVAFNDSLLSLAKTGKIELLGANGKMSGKLTDFGTGEPLPGVSIVVPGTKVSAVTDLNGKFTLDSIPKGLIVTFSFIGYDTYSLALVSDNVSYTLIPDQVELEEVVIMTDDDVRFSMAGTKMLKSAAPAEMAESANRSSIDGFVAEQDELIPEITKVETRKNFNETAFFYPNLRTNREGEIIIDFTIPEALTRWKMMGFAHTKDFKNGTISNTLITQKDVSIMVNAPRFLREGDTIEFAAKVNNLSESAVSGVALLQLFDPFTNTSIVKEILHSRAQVDFNIEKGSSKGIRWKLIIPEGIQAVNYKVVAKAGQHTDGEEATLPVLVNKKLVTESLPFMLRPGQTADYRFDKMVDQNSTTLKNEAYTIEFTSNPAWYAIQAMPYLMEYPYECSEQVFSRFFANSLSTKIVNSSPHIASVFKQWVNQDTAALISNLEKNQELKELLIQETPWLRNAESESERKKRVALLFDLNKMQTELQSEFLKLKNKQTPNGGFAWFDGMPDSWYITQHIVTGLAQLQHLEAVPPSLKPDVDRMLRSALLYLDNRIIEDYNRLLELERKEKIKLSDDHLSMLHIHYLYCKSFFQKPHSGEKISKAYTYYLDQAKKYWLSKGEYAQAMLALAFKRHENAKEATTILKSLSNRAIRSKELGMYWADNSWGYYWYQSPIETQSMLIEAFHEVTNDLEAVEEMKIWLLRNKQTSDWKTTKATASACYALLLRGTDQLAETRVLDVKLGGISLASTKDITAEAGTGYVKTSFIKNEIQPELGEISVYNPNNGVAWGAAYWQYFEQLDKITSAETNLKIKKQLFLKRHTNKGTVLEEITLANPVKVGDEVIVRIEIRADREFEYVHLKDMRAAGFEPISTLSQYKYQDGLGYYESIKDASVNFFIEWMRKGVYVFEYSLRAVHSGLFSNGITTMQSMYAPEFTSHSEGIRIEIKE